MINITRVGTMTGFLTLHTTLSGETVNVQSIPTFIIFKIGLVVDQMMGAVGAPGIHMICKKHSG